MQNELPPKFMVAKTLPADFSMEETAESLWRLHMEMATDFQRVQDDVDAGRIELGDMPSPEKSYLELKTEIARRIISHCHLCSRMCGVNRLEGKLGWCRCGVDITVSSIFEHLGEEPELVPSGTIFTMGCTMRCKHCQNWGISQWIESGHIFSSLELAAEIEHLRMSGCRNANLVGGEPTPWLRNWLDVFGNVQVNVPVVWNSNSYYSPETASLLRGFVDVYLLDFKYGPGECAERISGAPGYWNACVRNHLDAAKHGELIVRVLVLPDHLECCTRPILEWIAKNLGAETRVNLMFQYRPEWRAREVPELCRSLSEEEKKQAVRIAGDAGLRNFIT